MEFAPEGPMAIPMWVNGHAFLTVGPNFYEVVNPATGVATRRVPLCGAAEAREAVLAARAAQSTWAEMGMPARQRCLENLAELLETERYAAHFIKLLKEETGCDDGQAGAELAVAIAALRAASVGETGVFGLVLDSNSPLAGFAKCMAPALMAGATLVVKPSPKAPSAVFALTELTSRVEWPAGVVNLLQGDSAAIEGLCAAGVDRLVYRGEASLGQQVGKIAQAQGISFEMRAL